MELLLLLRKKQHGYATSRCLLIGQANVLEEGQEKLLRPRLCGGTVMSLAFLSNGKTLLKYNYKRELWDRLNK